MTELMVRHARLAAPSAVMDGYTARDGPPFVGNEASYEAATSAVLRMADEPMSRADGLLIACFGDPGLEQLRAKSVQPVAGLAEASLLMAASIGSRIAIVTGGAAWVPILRRFVARQGLAGRVGSISATSLTGPELAGNPARAVELLAAESALAVRDGADVIVLGGGALAGLADSVALRVAVPVVDCVRAGVLHLEGLIRLRA